MATYKFDPKKYDGGGKRGFEMPPAGTEVVSTIRKNGTEERTSLSSGNKYLSVKRTRRRLLHLLHRP
jgi:hypothetical protein